ncbi:hypothetical protein BH23PLA1_BH23PLA1_12030 [soil metagenome]
MLPPLNRRDFLTRTSASAAALAAASATSAGARAMASAAPARRAPVPVPDAPTSKFRLVGGGVEVSLLAMGTGSVGSNWASNQTRLGVKEFTRVARHAFDSGIRHFDVADQYGSHTYVREALKGIPRDEYAILTKTRLANNYADARSHLERYLMELGVDYIDTLLLHCVTTAEWPKEREGAMEYLLKAKEQGLIRAHGTSCHGMDPLRTAAGHPFVQVDLARINPEGEKMDDPDNPNAVAEQIQKMHDSGTGVIGMKVFGEGAFKEPERRDASLRYIFGLGTVSALTIGLESTEQVDDLIPRVAAALDHVRQQRG